MLRNMTDSNCLSDQRRSAFFAAGHGAAPGSHLTQESPWLGLLSAVTRPALSALQKLFPEQPGTLTRTHKEAGFGGELENVMLGDCQHLSLRAQQNLDPDSWISAGGLRELGIDCVSDVELNFGRHEQAGLLSSQRTLVGLVSARDTRAELLGSLNWSGKVWASGFLAKGQLLGTPEGLEEPASKPSSLLWSVVGDTSTVSFSQEKLLTPEQEHGYASLEDIPVLQPGDPVETRHAPSLAAAENSGASLEQARGDCRNKAIAFIMGLPCSDDDEDSQSDDDEDDDDGFDSQGSSLSSSSSSDEEGDDGCDGESDRLWTSFLSAEDPYNPRNFTARLHTPRMLPQAAASPTHSCERASPLPSPSPVLSSSPPCTQDSWDDSTSSSDDDEDDEDDDDDTVDEEEAARLLSLFSSSDPYDPFNFQAPVRTRQPDRCRTTEALGPSPLIPPSPPCKAAAPVIKQARSARTTKKVHFCDNVEEFFAGSVEEDRKGPWEELARDRHRFLRRCQEVELSISYCLQPEHRSLVYFRVVSQGHT